ncbi:hypothetical protein CesoFtcFv8_026525 [Champsocephalus esox]|uniref:C2H2-type domain-containing protein n=1 Tax=Champsocephalus esox TaxID=159716 RepID=A0AAN8AZA7_9TELE|nr:hypothetical protein CesoFtcFv8_026525 [Champsocephalus esox]
MSKGEILREIVTERLSAACRDILGAVDTIIAEYEDEVSGFRQQISRQKTQLELLQDLTGGEKGSTLDEEEQDEDEEEHPEKPENSTNQTPSRCQNKKRKPGIIETQKHVELRLRILEDFNTDVLTNKVLKKCPLLKLKCPRGLTEEDFLNFLRGSFPQLCAENKHFDILTSDKRRRLKPLKIKTPTAEEIHRNMRNSPLYIRLKKIKDPQASEEEMNPLQIKHSNTGDILFDETSSTCQEVEVNGEDLSISQQDIETEEAGAEDCGISEPDEGKMDGVEREEANDGDDDWKPDLSRNSGLCLSKTKKKGKAKRSGLKSEKSVDDFTCKVCGALHELESAVIKHALSHVDKTGSFCGVCGEHSESMTDHFESRHKTHDCHICEESFLSSLDLDEHVAAHSGKKPYECDVCKDAFALKVSLENHKQMHDIKKLHLCGVCGKSLCDFRSLSRHKMTHSGERPQGCQVCGRRFKLPGTLRQHEKIHTERQRSYLCDVCCKMFLTSKELQIHMRTHSNEKPYHCGECLKGFSTKGSLTIHMRVHTGETPYSCPDCGWSFKRKINLDNHATVHSGAKPFVCTICGKACARKTYLTVHMRTHNGERPYKCTFCDKAFTQSHCLKTHMKSHQGAEAAT